MRNDVAQLGHYVVVHAEERREGREVVFDRKRVSVVPPGGEGFRHVQLRIDDIDVASRTGSVQIVPLTASEARRIAQGLIVCAERLEYPQAWAGPEA